MITNDVQISRIDFVQYVTPVVSTRGVLFGRHAIYSLDRDSDVHRTAPSSVAGLWSPNTQV